MSNRLEQHLFNIEKKLGSEPGTDSSINNAPDRLEWHLTKIEELLDVGATGSGSLECAVIAIFNITEANTPITLKNLTGMTEIDWGDNNINSELTHVYEYDQSKAVNGICSYICKIYGITSIGEYAFQSCDSLTSVVIPDSVTSIGEWAFHSCTALTSVVIPDSVTSIGSYAFYNCDSLTSVVIGDSVTSIGEWAFLSCDSLTGVEVDENNANYKDIDGNLYSKDGSILLQYAIGKTATVFKIPDSVTSIGKGSFSYCSSLTSIVIPKGVTSIGNNAFEDCDSLTIYCEATSQPNSWDISWNHSNCPVVWGYQDKDKPAIVTEINKLTPEVNKLKAVTENLTDTSIPFWLNGQFQPLESLKVSGDGKQVFLGADDGQKLVLQDNQLYLQDKTSTNDPRKASITSRGGVAFDNFKKRTVYGYDSIDIVPSVNDEFGSYDEAQRKKLTFPNKSGTIAIAEDTYTKAEIDAGHYGLTQLAGFTIKDSINFTYNGMSCTGIRYVKGTNSAIVFDIWRTTDQTLASSSINAVVMTLGKWNTSGIRLDQLLSVSSLGNISEYKYIYPMEAHWVVKPEINGFQFNDSGFVVPQVYDAIKINGQATVWGMGVRFTSDNADDSLIVSGEYIRVMLTNFE